MIIALIQARMGSSRLPGKVLKPLGGMPAIDQVLARVKQVQKIEKIIVVTSIDSANLPLISHVTAHGDSIFVGSENDVLDRFWQATRLTNADHIVRITADCPLIDASVIDLVIQTHLDNNFDYTSNIDPPTWPDGLDVEIMKRSVLEYAWCNAKNERDREHVTLFIRENADCYRLGNVSSSVNLSDYRWTLDQEEDYRFLSEIFSRLNGHNICTTEQVLDLLDQFPELLSINSTIERNEGSALKEEPNE